MPGTDPTTLPGFQRNWFAEDATDAAGNVRGGGAGPTAFSRSVSVPVRSGTAATLSDCTGGTPGTPSITELNGVGLAYDNTYNNSIGGLFNNAIASNLPSRTNYTHILVIRAPLSHGTVATPDATDFNAKWPGTIGRNIWNASLAGNEMASGWCDEARRVFSYSRDSTGALTTTAMSGFTAPASRQIFIFEGDGTNHTVYTYRNGVIVNGTASNLIRATGTVSQFYLGFNGNGNYAWRGCIDACYSYNAALSAGNKLAACQFIADYFANTYGFPVKHSPTTKLTIVGDSIAGGMHSDRCENWVHMLDALLPATTLTDLQAVEGQDVTGFANASFFAATVGNADNDRGFSFSNKIALVALGANWLRQLSGTRITATVWMTSYATLIGRLRTAGYSKVFGVVPIAIGNAIDPDQQEILRRTYRTAMLASPLFDSVIDTLGTRFHPRGTSINAVNRCVGSFLYQLANGTTGITLDGTNAGIGTAVGLDGIHIGPGGQAPYLDMVRSNVAFANALGISTTSGNLRGAVRRLN